MLKSICFINIREKIKMKTIIIVSDEGARSHAKELEQLIKIIDWPGKIKQLDYNEYFPLAEDDTMFAVCPSKPFSNLLRVPAPAIKNTTQIIPVIYLGSEKRNLPSDLQRATSLVISGHYFPSFAVDHLCRMLHVPNHLDIQYIHPILQSEWLQQSLKSTLLATLSNLTAARRATKTTALQYALNLKNETLAAAEKLKNLFASLPESEQRAITDVLKDTPLGKCLEKIDLEKDQAAASIATTRFGH